MFGKRIWRGGEPAEEEDSDIGAPPARRRGRKGRGEEGRGEFWIGVLPPQCPVCLVLYAWCLMFAV